MKRILSLFLLCILTLSCFVGCDIWDNHTHSFSPKADDIAHYSECSCGEITNREEHIFEWVIDVQPTYTSSGLQHKECVTCRQKTEENTVVERLIHTDDFEDGLTVDFPNKKSFANKEGLIEFYRENKQKINYTFLCIDVSSNPEKGIYTSLSLFDPYRLHYGEETESEYTDPYIVVSYGIYSTELGPTFDEAVDGAESASFFMYFYRIDGAIDNYRLEFYENSDPKSALEYVVQIMSGDVCIGSVYYGSDVYISREWMADYLLDNLFVIN